MNPVKVKICGLTRVEQAVEIANLGVDAIGFILYPKSQRYVSPETVKSIVRELPPFTKTVGVLVNETESAVKTIYEKTGVDLIQLHGDESPEFCRSLMEANVPLIKAFRVRDQFDFSRIESFPTQNILLDAWSDTEYGGTGKSLNWEALGKLNFSHRVILAGGITPENIEKALNAFRPYAIDVSSGVEESPGVKSIGRVKKLLEKIEMDRTQILDSAYCVEFISSLTGQKSDEYEKTAQEMISLAQRQNGFIGMKSVRGEDGRGITLSYWEDLASIETWRNHPNHLKAQQEGKTLFYDQFEIKVCKVLREKTWKK